MRIIEERPGDAQAVRRINAEAFGGPEEATLVGRLTEAGLVILSLVAVEDEEPVGHVLFSRLDVEVDGRRVSAAALAPLAVAPDRQGRGIGSGLVRDGLRLLSPHQIDAVIVVGHPEFYRRFG